MRPAQRRARRRRRRPRSRTGGRLAAVGHLLADGRPVAVDGVEVASAGRRCARRCRPRRAGRPGRRPRSPSRGPAPATAARRGSGPRRRARSPGRRGRRRAGAPAGRATGSGASTYSRVGGEPLAQREPGVGGQAGQVVEVRPGPLGVHVVGRQRRDAAPVVDAGARAAGRARPGRTGSAAPGRASAGRAPAGRPRPWRRTPRAPRSGTARIAVSRLGPEVLDDDLLDVPVPPGRRADGEQRLDPLRAASRRCPTRMPVVNGIDGAAGVLEHPQPDGRILVRGAEVRLARLGPQPLRRRLQHHPHRRRDRLEPLQLRPGHHAGVEVRQQPGLLEHPDRHRPHVAQRRVVAVRRRATRAASGQRSSGRSPRVNSASLQPSAAPWRGEVDAPRPGVRNSPSPSARSRPGVVTNVQ